MHRENFGLQQPSSLQGCEMVPVDKRPAVAPTVGQSQPDFPPPRGHFDTIQSDPAHRLLCPSSCSVVCWCETEGTLRRENARPRHRVSPVAQSCRALGSRSPATVETDRRSGNRPPNQAKIEGQGRRGTQPNTVLQLTNTDAAQSVILPLCLLSVLAAECHVGLVERA